MHQPHTCRGARIAGVHEASQQKYYLFQAAKEGCKRCVAYYLEVEKVDPYSVSDHEKYSLMDWAKYACSLDVPGAFAVVEYLHTLRPRVRSRDERWVAALLEKQHAA